MIESGKKYLITTDGWFYAPDGQNYRAVWGIADFTTTKESMGFNPIKSTNWFVKVGEGEGSILIAGCQIHYAVRCDNKPVIKEGGYSEPHQGECLFNSIYIPG